MMEAFVRGCVIALVVWIVFRMGQYFHLGIVRKDHLRAVIPIESVVAASFCLTMVKLVQLLVGWSGLTSLTLAAGAMGGALVLWYWTFQDARRQTS